MQHGPDVAGLIKANLDEMVAGSQRAEVAGVVARQCLGVLLGNPAVAGAEIIFPKPPNVVGNIPPSAAVVGPAIVGAPVRDGCFDCRTKSRKVIRQIARGEACLDRHHAAADVHADRCRDDRALGRNHRADRRSHPPMAVGHDREVLVDEGQQRDIVKLLTGFVLYLDALRPCLDRHAARCFVDVARIGHFGHALGHGHNAVAKLLRET